MEEGRVKREVSRDEIRSKREMIIEELKPFIYCIFCNFCWAGFNIVSKISLNNGMSQYVLSVYGQIIGVFTLAILTFLFERNSKSKINLPILRDIFFLGLLGTGIARTLVFFGLEYTSPALAAAMSNLVPSITFILAVVCRMEKVDIYKPSTQAKILGSLVAFGGAAMLTLYKGIVVVSFHKNNFLHFENKRSIQHGDNWIKGSIFLLFSYSAMATFYILQTSAIKKYPAPITLTLHTSLCGGLFAIVIAAIQDHEPHSWRLSWNIALLGPIFNGIMITGVTYYVQTLVVRRRGPVFMTAFRPLSTIISAIMGLLLLGDALHLGGILGATLIIVGLYATLWGKEKEKDRN